MLYFFAFLYLASAGGGKWSVDALRRPAPDATVVLKSQRRGAD